MLKKISKKALFGTQSIFKQASDFLNSISEEDVDKSFDAAFDFLNEKKKVFKNKFLKQTKDGYFLSVKYDRDNETLNYTISDGRMKVVVSRNDETSSCCSTTEITIPNDVCENCIKCEYDEVNKEMHYFFNTKE